MTRLMLLAALGMALPACAEKPTEPAAPQSAAPKSAAAKSAAPAVKKAPPKSLAKKAKTAQHAKADLKWEGPIEWSDWEAGRARAKAEGKPLCLVVYADWCPRCRELAPIFAEADVVEAAEGLVMVKQDSDAKPAWLQEYKTLGGYVPRIFFFSPDGSILDGITSGHPRYPYFYTPRGKAGLVESMNAAKKG